MIASWPSNPLWNPLRGPDMDKWKWFPHPHSKKRGSEGQGNSSVGTLSACKLLDLLTELQPHWKSPEVLEGEEVLKELSLTLFHKFPNGSPCLSQLLFNHSPLAAKIKLSQGTLLFKTFQGPPFPQDNKHFNMAFGTFFSPSPVTSLGSYFRISPTTSFKGRKGICLAQ